MDAKPLHPNVRRMWRLLAAVGVLPLIALTIVGGWLLELPPLVSGAVVLALIVPAATVPGIAYRRWRYAIRDKDLYTSKGAIRHVETLIPFDRIQFVESRQGPLDRAFELTQVIVYTAAGKAGSIPGLDRPTAESIRDDLSKVAGTATV